MTLESKLKVIFNGVEEKSRGRDRRETPASRSGTEKDTEEPARARDPVPQRGSVSPGPRLTCFTYVFFFHKWKREPCNLVHIEISLHERFNTRKVNIPR